jgi:nucleotide-binding universal stress UspA family protein
LACRPDDLFIGFSIDFDVALVSWRPWLACETMGVSAARAPSPGRLVRRQLAMASGGDARPPVVVGVDGSDGSVAALRWAVRYGAVTGTPVRAVLAWHYPTAAAQPPVGHAPEAVNKQVEDQERAILREAIGKVAPEAAGADVHAEVRYGHPAEVLIEESGRVGLLVVGRRGHGGFLAKHLGSVSLHCVNAAECPVVVVHGHADGA